MEDITDKYFWESVGECVSQVNEIKATSWDEAKKVAFADMKEDDILAECPASAVKQNESYPEYSYIDEEQCTEYTKLCKGAWVEDDDGGQDFDDGVYYFSDDEETCFDSNGNEI